MGLNVPKRLKGKEGLKVSHKAAPAHEAASAKRLGGRLTAGSGSKTEKGDIRVNGIMRVECKGTINKSFSVTRDMLTKLEAAAAARNEIPAYEIRFLDPKSGACVAEYAVVPTHVLDLLVKVKRDGNS